MARPGQSGTVNTSLPTLLVPLRNRLHLFEVYYHHDGRDGVFVEGDVAFEVGEPLYVELNFLEEQRSFRLRGTVRWRRLRSARSTLPPGVGVEFDPRERATRDLVLHFARGREVKFTPRSAHRLPVALSISYASDAHFLTDVTDDLSAGGLFIATDDPLPAGTELDLKLKVPGRLLPIKVKGVVAWTSKRGVRKGMGVKFVFASERKRRQLEEIVEELKEAVIRKMQIRVPR